MISVILLFGLLFFFLFLGVPIVFSIGFAAFIVSSFINDFPAVFLAQKIIGSMDSFTLLAVPFFILAGSIMTNGGVSRRIINFASALVGKMVGGLAQVTLLGAAFFSALSGSSSATTAAVGGIMIPNMRKKGYKKEFAAAVAAAGGTMGQIIPPSILFIMYGMAVQQSIADLFLAGIGPGILMYISMAIVIFVISKKSNIPVEEERWGLFKTFKEGIWALLMPIIILGGIYGGIFTPTESAAVGAFYGLVISLFIYREISWKDLGRVFYEAVRTTSAILLIFTAVTYFGWLLVALNVPSLIAEFISNVSTNPLIILMIISGICLIVGTFMNAQPAMLILAPIFFPVSVLLEIDPIYFGIVMSVSLVIGVITPPVGVDLFVAGSIGNIPIEKVAKFAIPFVAVLMLDVLLIILFPDISLFLLNLFTN